jgi:putative transposase
MFRAFTYRLRPTKGQQLRLVRLLEGQRELYNAALEERRGAWAWGQRRVTKFEQYRELADLRAVRPEILEFGVTVCRGTLARLDGAFAGFYRRARAGHRPGYPRFRGRGRWDSVSWPDISGWKIDPDAGRLYLQGVGHVTARLHRRLRGTPKTVTVRRRGRHWDVTVFCAAVPAQPLPGTGRQVGLDLGVAALVATSEGELISNPRPRQALAGRLARAQVDRARRRRGSSRYRKASGAIGRVKAKEAAIRKDHLHQVSRRLVDRYDLICHEDLKVINMVRRAKPKPDPDHPGRFLPNGGAAKSGLNDAICDSGWATLLSMITYKAEDAGRTIIAVDPRHTSQRCAACGHIAAGNRVTQAVFRCQACGHEAHADINAANNILRAGLAQHSGAKPQTQAA